MTTNNLKMLLEYISSSNPLFQLDISMMGGDNAINNGNDDVILTPPPDHLYQLFLESISGSLLVLVYFPFY